MATVSTYDTLNFLIASHNSRSNLQRIWYHCLQGKGQFGVKGRVERLAFRNPEWISGKFMKLSNPWFEILLGFNRF